MDTQRTHPLAWERIKDKWLRSDKGGISGKWSARKAQLATREYQLFSREVFGDGGYATAKPKSNSLIKWGREDWGYIGSRYLPLSVRQQLTPQEALIEDKLKRGKEGVWVPYSPSVADKVRAAVGRK